MRVGVASISLPLPSRQKDELIAVDVSVHKQCTIDCRNCNSEISEWKSGRPELEWLVTHYSFSIVILLINACSQFRDKEYQWEEGGEGEGFLNL